MGRTDEYGADSRGQMFMYLPEALTVVRDKSSALYDERAELPFDEATVLSIMKFGVLKPINVRRNGRDSKGRPIIEIMDGRSTQINTLEANRRLRAAGKSEKELIRVPAIHRSTDDLEAMEIMITANEVRHSDDVVTRAHKLKRLLDRNGGDEKAAKVAFGTTKPRDFQKLKDVLEMSGTLQAALRDKKVTFQIAKELSRLPREKQPEALAKAIDPESGKARGKKARASAEKSAPPKLNGFKLRGQRAVVLALDSVACMPADKYREGVLHALEWILGKREVAWSAPAGKGKAAR